MWARALIGAGAGLLGGAVVGHFGKCAGGACPLTANPLRGGVFGMFIGAALAMAISTAGCQKEQTRGPEKSTQVTTTQEFNGHVLQADKPVLVDFYATWCKPCKQLAPIIDELTDEYKDRVQFVKVDVDQAQQLTSEYGVEAFPTVLIFSGGKPVKKIIGLRGDTEYRAALDAAIAGAK